MKLAVRSLYNEAYHFRQQIGCTTQVSYARAMNEHWTSAYFILPLKPCL